MDSATIIIITTFLAAMVNGGLGYGFSSITVPVALLFYSSTLFNPAIVLIEIAINLYLLALHWQSIKSLAGRVMPMIIGALPGILLGATLLASVNADGIKLITFSFLLPLVLLQAAGIRRPVQSEKTAGFFFGGGIGFFYAITTVSGPPLAIMLNNQGLAKKDFRTALGLIRFSLSSTTALSYYHLGFYQRESIDMLTTMLPSVIVGIPLGVFVIRRINPETFRRVCMSFDAWFVSFGLSRMLVKLGLLSDPYAYAPIILTVIIDGILMYAYVKKKNQ